MLDWITALIVVVSVLVTYIGIKIINKLFEDNKKNKNSLF